MYVYVLWCVVCGVCCVLCVVCCVSCVSCVACRVFRVLRVVCFAYRVFRVFCVSCVSCVVCFVCFACFACRVFRVLRVVCFVCCVSCVSCVACRVSCGLLFPSGEGFRCFLFFGSACKFFREEVSVFFFLRWRSCFFLRWREEKRRGALGGGIVVGCFSLGRGGRGRLCSDVFGRGGRNGLQPVFCLTLLPPPKFAPPPSLPPLSSSPKKFVTLPAQAKLVTTEGQRRSHDETASSSFRVAQSLRRQIELQLRSIDQLWKQRL